MTLRAMWSYDHVANPTAIALTSVAAYAAGNAYNILTGNPGTPILRTGATSLAIAASNNATTPGYLMFTNSSSGQMLSVALADIPLLQNGSTKAYLGFRTIATTLPGATSANAVFGVGATATASPTVLFSEAQLARVVNVAQYVEVMLDIGNNVYSVWVDGLNVVNQAALPTGWSYLMFGNGISGTGIFGFRDFYFADADSATPKRLGPITSVVAPLVAANAPNYTSSDAKTALIDLTTAYSGAPTAVPNIVNAPTNDPVTLNFQSNLPAGGICIGVQYKLAASVPFLAKLGVTLSNGQQTVTPPVYQFADTSMDYGRDMAGIQAVAPSGLAWGAAEFAATALTLTPQSQV